MAEYSQQEKVALGKVFPGKLFAKVVATIRDAILGAPKFAEKVEEIITSTICGAFGANNLQELVAKLTSRDNDIPTQIQTKVEELFHDPASIRALVEAILTNDEARAVLQRGLYQQERTALSEAKARRLENLSRSAMALYSARSPEVEITSQDVNAIVETMETAGTVRGKKADQYDAAVVLFIEDREALMTKTITGLCKARTDAELITSNARSLVRQGFDPADSVAVKAKLLTDEDIAGALKK